MIRARVLAGFGLTALLFGCARLESLNSQIVADLPTARQAAQTAITLYGIDKGIALIAAGADPTLAPVIDAIIAIADPLVANAQTALDTANADAATVSSLATQITTQATQLALTGAPVIKVVPGMAP